MSSLPTTTSHRATGLTRVRQALQAYERAQFGRPHGPIGHLVGLIMAIENRSRNAWAVALLAAQPSERVLEVGFGPGLAIAQIVQTTAAALIAGIDHSPVMLTQARRRNAAALAAGRVTLELGELATLPYPDQTFDCALLVNALHFSPNLDHDLAELQRVLRPGGRLVVVVQPVWTRTPAEVEHLAATLTATLTAAGFSGATLPRRPARPVVCLGVGATR